MRTVRSVAGAGLLQAPAATPDARVSGTTVAPPGQDVHEVSDDDLLDLLCDDAAWLDATFREIVEASWSEPPPGGPPRSSARPGRGRRPRSQDGRGHVRRRQWHARPHGRQRSPPEGSGRPPGR